MKTTLILIRPLISTGVLALVMAAARGRDPVTEAYLGLFGLLGGARSLATGKTPP